MNSTSANAGTPPDEPTPTVGEDATDAIASPYKRHRSSMSGLNSLVYGALESHVGDAFSLPPVAASLEENHQPHVAPAPEVKADVKAMSDDEEL